MPALAQTASPDQIRQLEAATRQVAEKTREIGLLRDEVTALKHQLEWFRKQIFGTRSESS